MSIQSSINQMLGNVGLLANTFQFQKQINKTEDISSQVAQLNEQRAQLEADKEKFKTESDEEKSNLKFKHSILNKYTNYTKRKINAMLKGVSPSDTDAGKFNSWNGNLNPYDLANAIASNVSQQRVDAERERKRKNQFENLQQAFQNIGMGGGNNNNG